MHLKGNRQKHEPNHLIPCCLCRSFPAKLQCTYTFGNFCHECYSRKHVKTLPKFLDLKPLKIDYLTSRKVHGLQGDRGAFRVWAHGEVNAKFEAQEGFSKRAPIQTTLGGHWHAFYDLRGVKYYYNFENSESMRRPHDRFVDLDAEKDESAKATWNPSPELKETLRQLSVSKDGRKLRQLGSVQVGTTLLQAS